jgi:hypothetical protein
MGTHIIWRNPCPPPKAGFKLRRVAGSPRATVYQVASPYYRHPFELIRSVIWPGKMARKKAEPGPPADPNPAITAAELVLARW